MSKSDIPEMVPHGVRLDLHVHTRRFSPCAEGLDPDILPGRIQKLGLDGLVITEHDHLWPEEEIARLNRRLKNVRIYRGVEVSSRNGHFLVIGLKHMAAIAPGIEIAALVRQAKSQQAAIIWAHPQLCYSSIAAPCSALDLPDDIDAVEVLSSVTKGRNSLEAIAIAQRMGWAQVGGSDAHIPSQIGCAVTVLEKLPANEKALAEVIQQGRCSAVPALQSNRYGTHP